MMDDTPTMEAVTDIASGDFEWDDIGNVLMAVGTAGASTLYESVGAEAQRIKDEKTLEKKRAKEAANAPKPLDPNDPEVLKKQDEEALKERRRAGGGRASTILTGGTGLMNRPTLSRRILLGN